MSSGGSITSGYAFNISQIRDASDWIAYKKQVRMRQDTKLLQSNNPWFIASNGVRLDWLNGTFKAGQCGPPGCLGSAFVGGFVGPNPGP